VAHLPQSERKAWIDYLDRSERQRQVDKQQLNDELKRAGLREPVVPAESSAARSIPLDRPAAWYATSDAHHVADVIVSFQTPAGGWSKNIDMSKEPRRPGQAFAPNNLSHFLAPGDFDTPQDATWNYVGTIDNDATTTQIRFLAKVIAADGGKDVQTYRTSFERGVRYLFAAQYPNGGWPQVWPLEGGYHDAITYNDDAMTEVMELLHDLSNDSGDFSFASTQLRREAAIRFDRGVQCILASQIKSGERLTVWPQQSDALNLKPTSARNFEMPAQSSSEGANLLLLLMNDLPHPSATEEKAVRAAATWFEKTAIYGQSWERTPDGARLAVKTGAGPIWSRYVSIESDKPVFGDRDKSIHDDVNELSAERRRGYRWYSADPLRALARFKEWKQEHSE
jgi:PelA/Pel-15E family pectate lyase